MFNYTKTYVNPYGNTQTEPNVPKIVIHAILGLIAVILIFSSFGTVGAGERGVKLRFGAVTGKVYGEGLYFKLPIAEDVVVMDVRNQKEEATATAASSDLQNVTAKIALNYSVQPDAVAKLYQTVGTDYQSVIIDPAIQESVKAVTAKFTAEQLITQRDEVKNQIKTALTTRLAVNNIVVDQFSVTNFDFSKSFNEAIEAKVTAEQNALAAKNKLAQVQYEAQQAIEEAKGKAEALRIEGQALSANPQTVQLRAIEKWNGVLPSTTGAGAIPFINVK